MQFDWTTFLLELVNFLVLVWILKRFLYRPVLDVIARRRAAIDATLAKAKATEDKAHELQGSYEQRLSQWEQERETARARLSEELTAERARRLAQLDEQLAAEREKAAARERRRADEFRRSAETEAIALASEFASQLLTRLAGAELDARLAELLVEDLGTLPEERRRALRDAAAAPDARVTLSAPRPLSADVRARVEAAVAALVERKLPIDVQVVPELVAGLRVGIGPWMVKASLADELEFFRSGAAVG